LVTYQNGETKNFGSRNALTQFAFVGFKHNSFFREFLEQSGTVAFAVIESILKIDKGSHYNYNNKQNPIKNFFHRFKIYTHTG